MTKKVLKPRSSSQLARYYVQANKILLGANTYVSEKNMAKFIAMEKTLRVNGWEPKDYSYTVVSVMKKWAESHDMHYIPINVFLGSYAVERYKKIKDSQSVEIVYDDVWDELLYNELMVAKIFIDRNLHGSCKFSSIVAEFKSLLSDDWLKQFSVKRNHKLIEVAISELIDDYDLQYDVTSYNDIISVLRDNNGYL